MKKTKQTLDTVVPLSHKHAFFQLRPPLAKVGLVSLINDWHTQMQTQRAQGTVRSFFTVPTKAQSPELTCLLLQGAIKQQLCLI